MYGSNDKWVTDVIQNWFRLLYWTTWEVVIIVISIRSLQGTWICIYIHMSCNYWLDIDCWVGTQWVHALWWLGLLSGKHDNKPIRWHAVITTRGLCLHRVIAWDNFYVPFLVIQFHVNLHTSVHHLIETAFRPQISCLMDQTIHSFWLQHVP